MTSRNHGSKISGSQVNDNRELKQRRRRQQRERQKKARGLYLQNNYFALASRFFVHFLAPSLHDCDMKLSNTRLLYKVGEHNTKTFFSFFS